MSLIGSDDKMIAGIDCQAADGNTDLLTFLFGTKACQDEHKIYIDAEHPERSYTRVQALTTIRKVIAGLKAIGIRKGDCVCVHAFNDINYPILVLAIIGAGAVFTGPNPAYTASELTRHMQMTKTKVLISESTFLENSQTAIEDAGLPATKVFTFDINDQQSPLSYQSWRSLLHHGEADWESFGDVGEAKRRTAALLSTSGTSGLPKAAMISHHNLIMQCLACNDTTDKPFTVTRLIALPIFHAFAFPLAHLSPIHQGITTYMMRRMILPKFMTLIRDYKISETAIVPPIVTAILKSSPPTYTFLRSLRTIWCAGAPLAQETGNNLFRLLSPTARLLQVWGMTEAGWITTLLWPERDHSGSVGRLLGTMEAKFVNEGKVVGDDNARGEIYVRGPFIMQGYLNNVEATRNMIDEDGWLRTGDVAYRDQEKFYIVDRQKELIKVRGWQVSPAEIEAQLMLHPSIQDAAVIGVPVSSRITGEEDEVPRAYVVTAPGTSMTEFAIKKYLSLHLAKYKALDGGVRFITSIPKNSTGKILRKRLREMAATEALVQRRALVISVENPTDGSSEFALPPLTGDSTISSEMSACMSQQQSRRPSMAKSDDAGFPDGERDFSYRHGVNVTRVRPPFNQDGSFDVEQRGMPYADILASFKAAHSLNIISQDQEAHEAYLALTTDLHRGNDGPRILHKGVHNS